jgi:hypothetical protein
MMSFFKHLIPMKGVECHETSSNEVAKIHKQTTATIAKTNKDIKRLNDLLVADGITLKIHIASGSHNG